MEIYSGNINEDCESQSPEHLKAMEIFGKYKIVPFANMDDTDFFIKEFGIYRGGEKNGRPEVFAKASWAAKHWKYTNMVPLSEEDSVLIDLLFPEMITFEWVAMGVEINMALDEDRS